MADKNIQIKHHNGSAWYDLFPKTKASLIDLNDGRSVQEVVSGLVTQISKKATKQEVEDEIERLIGGAPEALDTLVELAEALGNDDDFATSITTQIGKKVDKVSGKQLSSNDFTNALKTKLDSLKDHTTEIASLFTEKADKTTTYTKAEVDSRTYTKTEVDNRNYTKAEVDSRMSNLQANAIPVSETEPVGASVWFQEI